MNHPNAWRAEQVDALRASYPAMGVRVAAQATGRSESSVLQKAHALGLKVLHRNERHAKLTQAQKSEVVRLYSMPLGPGEAALSVRQIVEVLKLPVEADCVYKALRDAGVARAKTGERCRTWTEAKELEVVAAYGAGATQPELGKKYGCGPGQISVVLKRRGVTCRLQERKFTPEEVAEIVRRYRAGDSAAEIAPAFGVYHKRVLSVVRAAGVSLRPTKRYPWTDRLGRRSNFRSSWELVVAQFLDASDMTWTYEERYYEVVVNGLVKRYTPDFHVYDAEDKLTTIIEVKGWTRDPHGQTEKRELLRQKLPGVVIEVWNADVMAQKGLLQRVTALYPSVIARNNYQTLAQPQPEHKES